MSKQSIVYSILVASSLAVLPVPALAISQLTVSSQGDGVFVVTGKFENVAAMQLKLSYDSATLSNPRVAPGALTKGMLNASNTASNPIQIAAVGTKSISGTGPVAAITFDRSSSAPGSVTGLTGMLLDVSGREVALAQPQVYNPVAAASTAAGSGSANNLGNSGSGSGTTDTGKAVTATAGNQPYVVGGSVTLPGDPLAQTDQEQTPAIQVAQETTERQPASDPSPAASQPVAPPAPQPIEPQPTAPQQKKDAAEAPPALQPVRSVLEKFRLFSGGRTVNNLTTLFNAAESVSFRQSPAVAIADGKMTVTVIISNVSGDKAPTFTFASARAVSVQNIDDGVWEVTAKPEKGAVSASIGVNANGATREIPLTVAPKSETKLTKSGTPESDFQLFLNDRGTASAPKHDLNGDGKRDYQDDYIYSANYLAQNGTAQVKALDKDQKKVTAERNR